MYRRCLRLKFIEVMEKILGIMLMVSAAPDGCDQVRRRCRRKIRCRPLLGVYCHGETSINDCARSSRASDCIFELSYLHSNARTVRSHLTKEAISCVVDVTLFDNIVELEVKAQYDRCECEVHLGIRKAGTLLAMTRGIMVQLNAIVVRHKADALT